MKKSAPVFVVLGIVVVAIGIAVLKVNVPLSYKESDLRSESVVYVLELQRTQELSAREAASKYLYAFSEYHTKVPDRIQITAEEQSADRAKVRFYDPAPRDDSMTASMRIIHMMRNASGDWEPVKFEWSQKGRGRFGWTTKPTN